MWAWMWLAAGDLVHPEWSELAPWRTWAVVENVQPARHWFVLDPIPVLGKRCEVGLVAEGRRGPPVVWCGPARIGDAAVQDAPASMKKEERAARDALRPYLGDSAEALDGLRMRFLGTLRDVTFRQIVVVEPAADPGQSRAITLTATWQVDPVSGRVDRGPVPPDTRVGPVCLPGIHTGCDQPPRLLEWAPEEGWDGMLYEATWLRGEPPVDDGLTRAVRAAAKVGASFIGAPRRAVAGGLLPDDIDAAAVMTLVAGSPAAERRHEVDLPLNDLVAGPVVVRFPLEGTPAQVEVIARLAESVVEVTLRAPGAEPAGVRVPVQCDVLRDGPAGVLRAPCAVDGVSRWVVLTGPAGEEIAHARVEGLIEPLVVPSTGPGLR